MIHSAWINTLSENCTTLSAMDAISAYHNTKTRNNHAKSVNHDTINDFIDTISDTTLHNTYKKDATRPSMFTIMRETGAEHCENAAKDIYTYAMDSDTGTNTLDSPHNVMK